MKLMPLLLPSATMAVIETSMPRTAPAKAAVADGIGRLQFPADILPATALGSKGATVT